MNLIIINKLIRLNNKEIDMKKIIYMLMISSLVLLNSCSEDSDTSEKKTTGKEKGKDKEVSDQEKENQKRKEQEEKIKKEQEALEKKAKEKREEAEKIAQEKKESLPEEVAAIKVVRTFQYK